MTVDQFLGIQGELMNVFGWFARWWLIAFLVGAVFAAVFAWLLVTAREMVSKI